MRKKFLARKTLVFALLRGGRGILSARLTLPAKRFLSNSMRAPLRVFFISSMKLLADFLASVKSSLLQKRRYAITPGNTLIFRLCALLEELGYINGYTKLSAKTVKVYLKYYNNKTVIRTLNSVSKPSLRVYLKKRNMFGKRWAIWLEMNAFLILTTSSSKKLLTDIECIMYQVGGEVLVCVS